MRSSLPTPPLQLVGREAAYIPFATAQFMHNSRQASLVRDVPREVQDHHQHALMERWWNDPGVTFLFAAHPPDTNFVFGYLVGESTDQGPLLHWLLVRRSMRGMGIARELLRAFLGGQQGTLGYYTHSTPHWRRVLDGRDARQLTGDGTPFSVYQEHPWVYNPYLLWEQSFRRAP